MATLQDILRDECGFEIRYGPAAAAYRESIDLDDLRCAAGEHLCLHAHAIMRALRLPRRGTLVLAVTRKVSYDRWVYYWKLHNKAFCACALISLGNVRQFIKQAKRLPEMSEFIYSIFIMSCLYREKALRMNDDEKELFREQSAEALVQFEQSSDASQNDPLSLIFKKDGVDLQLVDMPWFIRQAIIMHYKLEPHVLMDEYDRLSLRSRCA